VGELFNIGMMLAAFGSGILGAAIGGLPAFIFCGFLVAIGEAVAIAGGPAGGVVGITGGIGFGVLFGPHVMFGGAAAAAAYAGHVKGSLSSGADILTPLIDIAKENQIWDILLIGGIFGVYGHLLRQLFGTVWGLPTDPIALAVIISAFTHRIIFCPTGIFGSYDSKISDSFWKPTKDIAWLPWQMHAPELIMLGLGVGLVSGYITLITGSAFIMFGVTGASLILLETKGTGPVTHHIAFPASAAAAAIGGIPGIIAAGIYGLLGAFLGEFFARLFYNWGDSHIDPPACAIAALIFIIIVFHGFNFTVPVTSLL